MLAQTEEPNEATHEVDYKRLMRTQINLIKSRFVINAALQQRSISQLTAVKNQKDPVSWLADQIEVTNPEDTEILEIALVPGSGISRADEANLINAVTKAYIEEVVNQDHMQRQNRLEMLKKISRSYADMTRTRREQLRELRMQAGGDESIRLWEQETLPRLYQDLRSQQVKLRIEQAGTATLLERKKKQAGTATNPSRPGDRRARGSGRGDRGPAKHGGERVGPIEQGTQKGCR